LHPDGGEIVRAQLAIGVEGLQRTDRVVETGLLQPCELPQGLRAARFVRPDVDSTLVETDETLEVAGPQEQSLESAERSVEVGVVLEGCLVLAGPSATADRQRALVRQTGLIARLQPVLTQIADRREPCALQWPGRCSLGLLPRQLNVVVGAALLQEQRAQAREHHGVVRLLVMERQQRFDGLIRGMDVVDEVLGAGQREGRALAGADSVREQLGVGLVELLPHRLFALIHLGEKLQRERIVWHELTGGLEALHGRR